jgi:hypothetical protein
MSFMMGKIPHGSPADLPAAPSMLECWFERAILAASVAEVIDEPS